MPLIAKPVSHLQLAPGSVVTIPEVAWSEYEAILTDLGEHRSARVTYYQGTLEIMAPLPEHERPKELISDMVKTLLKKQGTPYEPFGSTTFKQLGVAGIEPDACFYIQNAPRMIARRRLQPGDPPPDVAIESDVTSKTALAAYLAIGVPELWIFASGQLTLYRLIDGLTGKEYQPTSTSPLFPGLPITELVAQTVDRSWQVGSYQALLEFERQLP